MALTNYAVYKWLIYLLEKEADEQNAMTLKEITQRYIWDKDKIYTFDKKTGRKRTGLPERVIELVDAEGIKHKEYLPPKIEAKTFNYWRYAIYKQFGLLIQQPIVKNVVKNKYYLANPELLEENLSLRTIIEHLVDDEKRGFEAQTKLTVSQRGRKKKVEGVSSPSDSMGFISVGNGYEYPDWQFGYNEEPEMVDYIRFYMSLGEALIIRNGNKNMVLESQELKTINGRWYVIGNLYEYGDEGNDTSRLVVYDVETLNLSEEEDLISPLYNVVKDFNSTHLMPWDWNKHFSPDKVVSLYFGVMSRIFEIKPFCDTQVKVGEVKRGILSGHTEYIYKIYVKPNKDFLLQYFAYDGIRMRVCEAPNDIVKSDTDITEEQINYLRSIKRGKK